LAELAEFADNIMFEKVAKGKAKLFEEKSELFGSMAARRNYTQKTRLKCMKQCWLQKPFEFHTMST
jgi:hypothetical protein